MFPGRKGQSLPAEGVVLGLGLLVIRAVSRGIYRGDCELRKTLSSLSLDGWDYVSVFLVIWPEASQH